MKEIKVVMMRFLWRINTVCLVLLSVVLTNTIMLKGLLADMHMRTPTGYAYIQDLAV